MGLITEKYLPKLISGFSAALLLLQETRRRRRRRKADCLQR